MDPNSSSGNMVVQHTIAIVLCAAVASILGLGTLAVRDIGEIRHPAMASEVCYNDSPRSCHSDCSCLSSLTLSHSLHLAPNC